MIRTDEETLQSGYIQPHSKQDKLLQDLFRGCSNNKNDPIECAKTEVNLYFTEPAIGATENLLCWWKKNEMKFPLLARLARKYLAIPATSAPAERLFSVAGLVLEEKRTNLKPNKVDKILFLFSNLKQQL